MLYPDVLGHYTTFAAHGRVRLQKKGRGQLFYKAVQVVAGRRTCDTAGPLLGGNLHYTTFAEVRFAKKRAGQD